VDVIPSQRGHFEFESGYHGAQWMDLETLFLDPRKIELHVIRLAERVKHVKADVVCGPLVEGAYVALGVARALALPFTYSDRYQRDANGLYPYGYRIPASLHPHLKGRRVLIVNDVISAGSAVRGTAEALRDAGAQLIGIGALLVLGDWSAKYAAEHDLVLETLNAQPFEMWRPSECPLCADGVPLERRG